MRKRFGKLRIVDSAAPPAVEDIPAPPRPPKPAHMSMENPGHNYLNLDGATESSKPVTPATPAPSTPATAIITDETYDFPRSHQPDLVDSSTLGRRTRHCYTNAAPTNPGGKLIIEKTYVTTTSKKRIFSLHLKNYFVAGNDERVFRYDFHDDEPSSPRSESSATATYSNLPSPKIDGAPNSIAPVTTPATTTTVAPTVATLQQPPPVVYRELKPGRKTSDTLSMISNELSPGIITMGSSTIVAEPSSAEHSPAEPPSINRKLKPPLTKPTHESKLKNYLIIFIRITIKFEICNFLFLKVHYN